MKTIYHWEITSITTTIIAFFISFVLRKKRSFSAKSFSVWRIYRSLESYLYTSYEIMCGRTSCTLCKSDLQRATSQYSLRKCCPEWIEKYSWQKYMPNYNLSPGQVSPVLVMSDVISAKVQERDIVLFPMKWGLIPSWYQGDLKNYSCKTNNARIEGLENKPTYKKAVLSGQRCVVLADGFYEWKIDEGKAQPYFIQFPNENEATMYDRTWESCTSEDWNGPNLLTMAGIFDIWKSPEGGELLSYSVITMNSSEAFSSIHHRMPAILKGNEEVRMWLDSKISYNAAHAFCFKTAVENLDFYPVSTKVNNSKYNDIDCLKPICVNSKAEKAKQAAITNWLKRKPDSDKEEN